MIFFSKFTLESLSEKNYKGNCQEFFYELKSDVVEEYFVGSKISLVWSIALRKKPQKILAAVNCFSIKEIGVDKTYFVRYFYDLK